MAVQVRVSFENGVFVPQEKVELPERTVLTVNYDVPATGDPKPTGGVELVRWRARHRLEIDPETARQIIESKELADQEAEE